MQEEDNDGPAHLRFLPSHFIDPDASDDADEWRGVSASISPDEDEDEQPEEEPAAPSRGRKPGRKGWLAEHDRALILAMLEHKPFEAPRGEARTAWAAVKCDLDNAGLVRSLGVIRDRVNELVKEEKVCRARCNTPTYLQDDRPPPAVHLGALG